MGFSKNSLRFRLNNVADSRMSTLEPMSLRHLFRCWGAYSALSLWSVAVVSQHYCWHIPSDTASYSAQQPR
ncbi:MAG: hypothetical protein ACJAW7_001297 [Candidatus Azotimanducaceae bacterium]|jgi:hypothetical protein